VLEIVGKAVQITGFPWQDVDEMKNVGIDALTSGILCVHHNSELSPLDEAGRSFLHALKSTFDQACTNDEFNEET
jgi:hypothetical protein